MLQQKIDHWLNDDCAYTEQPNYPREISAPNAPKGDIERDKSPKWAVNREYPIGFNKFGVLMASSYAALGMTVDDVSCISSVNGSRDQSVSLRATPEANAAKLAKKEAWGISTSEKSDDKSSKYYYRNEGRKDNQAMAAFRGAKRSGNLMGCGGASADALTMVANGLLNHQVIDSVAPTTVFAERSGKNFTVVVNEPYLHGNKILRRTYCASPEVLNKIGIRVR